MSRAILFVRIDNLVLLNHQLRSERSKVQIDYALLGTIHRMLRQRTDLEEQLNKGPRRVKIVEAAEKKMIEDLTHAKDDRQKAKMMADEKQLHLGSRESKIEDLKSRLNSAASNKEFQLLKDQIAADEQANLVLSDELFEVLEKIDTMDSGVSDFEKGLVNAQRASQDVRDTVAVEMKSLESELVRVNGELSTHESMLPPEISTEYRRVVESRGEDTFASTDAQTCGNCFTTLTPQTRSQLISRKPVFCSACGCIMYLKVDPATLYGT